MLDSISWTKAAGRLRSLKIRTRHNPAVTALVSKCARDAAAVVAETEPEFLNLTRDLKNLHECATELGRSTDQHIASLQNTISQTRLSGSDGLAGVLLDGIRSAVTETEAELNSLRKICAALTSLVHLGGQIELTGVLLNTARYSFRVESARTEATRQSFGAFTEELEPLANQVGAVGEAISGQARNARSELGLLVQKIGNDSDQLRTVTADMGRILEQTCRKGQELLSSSSAAVEESTEQARNRERYAEEAVYHVQFGDITRQKVEHIAAALSELAEHFTSPGSITDATWTEMDRVLAIQCSQIERIESEICSVEQGLESSFAGLAKETEAVARTFAELGGAEVLEELKGRLSQLERLEIHGHAMREQSRASWKRAVDTSREASRQMDQLREINFRMHLQSLNAIIKTEWLGEEGLMLGVLSSHIHRVFSDSNALVAETGRVLQSLSNQTDNSLEAAGPGVNLAQRLTEGLLSISRVQDEFKRTVEAARDMAERQASQLERARGSLGILRTLGVRLRSLAGAIRDLRSGIAPRLDVASGPLNHPLVFARRYTMESEREVHRLHSMEPESEREPAAVTPGNELGDNIEFF